MGNTEHKIKSDMPPPVPTKILKKHIFADPDFFKEVDDYAVTIAKYEFTVTRAEVKNLLKQNFDDIQKARAIYIWMKANIMREYNTSISRREKFNNSEDMTKMSAKCAKAFENMASFAGMHCVQVPGWVKSCNKIEEKVTGQPINHTWNAIYIDGDWHIIDCYFGTRSDPSFQALYFLPDPEQFIFSHLPEDPAWQLCNRIRSNSEFDNYPKVFPAFFATGMQFLQQKQGIIYTHNGILTLTLGRTKPSAVSFRIYYGVGRQEAMEGVPLKKYMIQETRNDAVIFYFRAPKEGFYTFEVFTQPEDLPMEILHREACAYKIICEERASDVQPYPNASPENLYSYGSGPQISDFGLRASQKNAILVTSNGQTAVTFENSEVLRLHVKLNNEELTNEELRVAVSVQNTNGYLTVMCNLPKTGEYLLQIRASKPDNGGYEFSFIAQYLITYTKLSFEAMYGKVCDQHHSDVVPYNYSWDVYKQLSSFDQTSNHQIDTDAVTVPSSPTSSSQMKFWCPICLEEETQIENGTKQLKSTTCGHIFCATCIDGVLQTDRKCPTCRMPLNSSDVHPVYLP